MSVSLETFRCMACGHEYQDKVDPEADVERSCPKCRSNSVRHLKGARAAPAAGAAAKEAPA